MLSAPSPFLPKSLNVGTPTVDGRQDPNHRSQFIISIPALQYVTQKRIVARASTTKRGHHHHAMSCLLFSLFCKNKETNKHRLDNYFAVRCLGSD